MQFQADILGFDINKNRLGMGGGFYDKSFEFCNSSFSKIILVGIAFDQQHTEKIAINSWDIKMDVIITPTKIIR